MAASNWAFTSNGAVYSAGAWLDGSSVLHPYVQPSVEGVLVNASAPLPVREPPTGAPIDHNGITATVSSAVLVDANSSRKYIEIGNGGASGIWVRFAAAVAVVGTGSYLPAKTTNIWPYAGEVRVIVESGGSNTPVGYVEW